jgi:hypothetical protein
VFGDGEETNHHNRDTSKEKGSKYHNLQNQTELKKPQTAGDEQKQTTVTHQRQKTQLIRTKSKIKKHRLEPQQDPAATTQRRPQREQ